MSTNRPAESPPPIQTGDIVTADWLNKTRSVQGVVGADGVEVSTVGKRLAINARRVIRAPGPAAVLAEIATETGSGRYTWTRVGSGEGPASGSALELTEATGVAVGTKVWLYKVGGAWCFYNTATAGAPKRARYTNATSGYVVGNVEWTTLVDDDDGLLDTAAGFYQNKRFVAQENCLCRIVATESFYASSVQVDMPAISVTFLDSGESTLHTATQRAPYFYDWLGTGTTFQQTVAGECELETGGFVVVGTDMRVNALASTIRTAGSVSVVMVPL